MQQDEICQNRQLVLFVSVFMNKQRKQIANVHFSALIGTSGELTTI